MTKTLKLEWTNEQITGEKFIKIEIQLSGNEFTVEYKTMQC